jgi:hypothetical protein
MARLRVTEASRTTAVIVPIELHDPTAEVWQDADRFRDWLRRNGSGPSTSGSDDPVMRFRAAAEIWAVQNHFTTDSGNADWMRLRHMGVRPGRRLRKGGVVA